MSRVLNSVPRLALFLAGLAAGALGCARRDRRMGDPQHLEDLKNLQDAIANLEARLGKQETVSANRLHQVESRLDEQAAKLAEVPTTSQITAAMEQVLSRSMASLDERLTTQAHSIEVLKMTVSQTDNLLERVLESLDSLQSYSESSELAEETLLHRPAV